MTEVTAYPLFNKADLASDGAATKPLTEIVVPPTLTLKEFARRLANATGVLVDELGPRSSKRIAVSTKPCAHVQLAKTPPRNGLPPLRNA